jgi:hypothetical protein
MALLDETFLWIVAGLFLGQPFAIKMQILFWVCLEGTV